MKIVAIVQARMGSSRLPGKVMMKIQGIPMIEILLKRLSSSKLINQIIVATTEEEDDHTLYEYLINSGYKCEKGNTNNVLERYLNVAEKYEADVIVRITGDCPLIDPSLVDKVIKEFIEKKVDYASNTNPPTYPFGLDI